MGNTASVNFHSDTSTEIRHNPPESGKVAVGGWITLQGLGGSDVTIFPPNDVRDAAIFWRTLASSAEDMAAHCEDMAERES